MNSLGQLRLDISRAQMASMDEYLRSKIRKIPTATPSEPISEFAELRIMPPGTPRPGPWENSYTPYLVEPMDNMSPNSLIQRDITMKAGQGGWTAACENIIGFYMKRLAADIMYLSATQDLLERWASRRLEPMINSFGIRGVIEAIETGSGSRKTGDKTYSKEYSGCRLDMVSAQSASSLRSTDKRIMIRDEIDGAPKDLHTGEGNFMKVSWVRTNSWGARRKVMDLSTPKTYDNSLIWQEYQLGDQRIYMVPCPHCGCFQELRFGDPERTYYGIKAEKKAGELLFAYYQCEHCHDPIMDYHKEKLLIDGQWEPTSRPTDKTIASRHWSALYSPTSMVSFTELYKRYEEALTDPDGMRSFRNLYLGLPYKEKSSRPKLENVIELRGEYKSSEISDGVLYLTMGMDVQRGKADNPNFPARLEYEVLGHGRGYKTWSVKYGVIAGAIDDPFGGAWEELDVMLREGGFIFTRKDGAIFEPRLSLIDSGHQYHTVLRFCERWTNIYPSKGFGRRGFESEKKRKEKGDEYGGSNFRRYRQAPVQGGDTILVEVATNHYKGLTYGCLKIPRAEVGDNPPGFCNFPGDYPKQYFKGLTAEEQRTDGSFHETTIPNEPLDCRVLNLCAGEMYLDTRIERLRKQYLKDGYTKEQVTVINKKRILKILEEQTKPLL